MSEEKKDTETISLEAALRMEIFISQALIDLLVAKGIFTQEELMEKIKDIRMNSDLVLGKANSPK